jgi:hypothetical protein
MARRPRQAGVEQQRLGMIQPIAGRDGEDRVLTQHDALDRGSDDHAGQHGLAEVAQHLLDRKGVGGDRRNEKGAPLVFSRERLFDHRVVRGQ